MTNIRIVNKSRNPMPSYATQGSAGMDIKANLNNDLLLPPNIPMTVPTGLYMEIPEGHEAQIRPRSGLASKHGVTVCNSPGTVDQDFRGEVKIILINLSKEDFVIHHGDRIAQMVISKYEKAYITEADELSITDRGECGFGSSGIK